MEKVLQAVCEATGIDKKDIFSYNKRQDVVDARFIFCSIAKNMNTRMSMDKIGQFLSRDRSVIARSIQKSNWYYDHDLYYKKLYDRCMKISKRYIKVKKV